MNGRAAFVQALGADRPDIAVRDTGDRLVLEVMAETLAELAFELISAHGCEFATLVIEQSADGFVAHYFFYRAGDGTLIEINVTAAEAELPAISDRVHAADWHEREAEDMFGIHFSGHPFLGDFVLHDTDWPEGVEPMRRGFDPHRRAPKTGLGADWWPRQLLEEPGALVFPVGPVWSDYAESGLWLLETPGEQIRQAHSRLFYKYRGVEKIAEGQEPRQALLLAERFNGNSAFAHACAYCQALEKIADCEVPSRARALRIVFAEFERIRYHAASIAELAGSTGLVVGKAMGQEIEEALLRLAGEVCGHRYLYGLATPGGLAWAPDAAALERLKGGVREALARLNQLERLLINSSSFLDRIEEMGTLSDDLAELYGVVGPVASASARRLDLRRSLPYGGYADATLSIAR